MFFDSNCAKKKLPNSYCFLHLMYASSETESSARPRIGPRRQTRRDRRGSGWSAFPLPPSLPPSLRLLPLPDMHRST